MIDYACFMGAKYRGCRCRYGKIRENTKKYLDQYGKHSLDRVIMGDPGWPNADDINECTKKLEIAIKNDAPIEQIPME